MFIDFMLLGLLALLAVPTICGYYAHSRGRSFWLWFAIGTALPVISYFILIFLPDKSSPVSDELRDLRLKNKMLGTVPDIPMRDPLRHVIQQAPLRVIAFRAVTNQEGGKGLLIEIDGRPLDAWMAKAELPYARKEGNLALAGSYMPVPLTLGLPPYRHFLGEPSRRYSHEGKPVLLLGSVGLAPKQRKKWRLSAKISFYRRLVVWHHFELAARAGKWNYYEPEVLVFDRYQYEEALANLAHCLN